MNKKTCLVAIIHVLAVVHMAMILSKDASKTTEGILFVFYVVAGTLYWKKIAQAQRKKYDNKKIDGIDH